MGAEGCTCFWGDGPKMGGETPGAPAGDKCDCFPAFPLRPYQKLGGFASQLLSGAGIVFHGLGEGLAGPGAP